MNWSRLGGAAAVALLIAFVFGAILSPPDPVTQLLYVGPLFVVLTPLAYRYWL
ncbi:DUF7534 family protein [Halorussus litoreus]|uniref:DUF7534 family protein n=1 Tax=Halorussus litoreus TaxID=1710536 RepID=UPI001300580D|nr:hypothetical protein [Halorussus litoreus]